MKTVIFLLGLMKNSDDRDYVGRKTINMNIHPFNEHNIICTTCTYATIHTEMGCFK